MNTKKNLLFSSSDIIFQLVINFIVGIILARLLGPEIIGVIGIISAVQGLLFLVVEGGLQYYIINNQKIDSIDLNTVFFSNIFISTLIFMITWYAAPYISNFYEQDITTIIRVMLLNLFTFAPSVVYRALFIKTFKFNLIALTSFFAVLISGCAAVLLALNDYGVWSFMVRIFLGQLLTLILFVWLSDWNPSCYFSFFRLKKMTSYSSKLFFTDVLNKSLSDIYVIFVGKAFSLETLGFYTRANQFKEILVGIISNSLKMVGFSELSTLKDVNDRQRKLLFFQDLVVFSGTAFSTFVFFNGDIIVNVLLGSQWKVSIVYLVMLSPLVLIVPIYNLNLNFLAATGSASVVLWIELLSKFLTILVMIVGYFWGIYWMIVCLVLASLISCIVSIFFVEAKGVRIKNKMVKAIFSLPLFFCFYFLNDFYIFGEISLLYVIALKVFFFLFLFSIYCYFFYRDALSYFAKYLIYKKINS